MPHDEVGATAPSRQVLYVTTSGLTAVTGGGTARIIGEAAQASKQGFPVRILCFYPLQRRLTANRIVRAARANMEQLSGCSTHFVPRLPLGRVPGVRRLNDAYCGFVTFLFCRRYGIRVVHGHGSGNANFGLLAGRLQGDIRVVADMHGAAADEYLYESNLSEPDRTAREIEKRDARVLSGAHAVIFVSSAMRRHYEGKYSVTFPNSCVVPCATNASFCRDNARRDALRRENGLEGKTVFCYVGSGERYQLPDSMCRLFANIARSVPDAFFLVFTHHQGIFQHSLNDTAVDPSRYRVMSVPPSQVLDLLQMGDVGFLLRDASIVNRVASPTKFGEYCLSGLPVITTPHVGDFGDLVSRFDLGYLVDLDDLSFTPRLAAFVRDVQQQRAAYAERCAAFAKEHLTYDGYGKALAAVYAGLQAP